MEKGFPPAEKPRAKRSGEVEIPAWESLRTIKRYRMERDLTQNLPPKSRHELIPWSPSLLKTHAKVLFLSFQESRDTSLFPGLGTQDGCEVIMEAIAGQRTFLPGSTLLAVSENQVPVGSIQAMEQDGEGLIMNVGVVQEARGKGVGRSLIWGSLNNMVSKGLKMASLEVSGENEPALKLYESCGFQKIRVHYQPLPGSYRTKAGSFWELPLDLW